MTAPTSDPLCVGPQLPAPYVMLRSHVDPPSISGRRLSLEHRRIEGARARVMLVPPAVRDVLKHAELTD